jgi:hypothetical protein
VPWPSLPHDSWQTPCGEQVCPPGHGVVGEHSAQRCALQAWASKPAPSHWAQSLSMLHDEGHAAEHSFAMHRSVD